MRRIGSAGPSGPCEAATLLSRSSSASMPTLSRIFLMSLALGGVAPEGGQQVGGNVTHPSA